MMEEELSQLLKAHGWSLFTRKRRAKEYLYARKWLKREVYISPLSKLPEVTEEEVLRKLEAATP